MNETLLTTHQAAKYLQVSKAFLERDRWAGAQVPFVRIGGRSIRYRLSDLEAYVRLRVRRSNTRRGD